MKFAIPEISWHNRDPVLSVDIQPKTEENGPLRLATGGTDSHVLIWYLTTTESGSINIDVAADLTRHQKAVNVVRWSPNGQLLASGDDESIIFIWQQKTDKEIVPVEQGEEQYKETWVIYKTLRGHMEDVLDLSWSADSLHLASGSVDNKLIVWDVNKGKYTSIIGDHKGFVQGVAWDPQGTLLASTSTDRVFRTFDVTTKKVLSRSCKANLPFPSGHPLHNIKVRLYHDDTLQTYYRRLSFSPDGMFIAVPAGRIEPEQGKIDMKPINAIYIYTRYSLKVPVCVIPCGEPALALRWAPLALRPRADGPRAALGRRLVLAAATKRAVTIIDTQQRTPVAIICNIHYTRLTDLTWSPDGLTLVASSTDGYCSVITFGRDELGEPLPDQTFTKPIEAPTAVEEQEPKKVQDPKKVETKDKPEESKPANNVQKIDSFIKFKTPSQKSPKKQKIDNDQKTPIKIDVLEDTAMSSWSDNSNTEIVKPKQSEPMDVDKPSDVIEIEDSEDMKLVYEETESRILSPIDKGVSPKDKDGSKKDKTESPANKAKSTKEDESPERKRKSSAQNTPKSSTDKSGDSNFLKQAKVTDIKEPATKAAPSPKAPRRVSFVTLSSPKNAKKK